MSTIRDVARGSGVSISTVSTVLTGAARPVNAETRQRVLDVAASLNYHPNTMAQALVRRRINSIGVLPGIFPAEDIVANEYAAGVMQGILHAASDANQAVTLFTQPWKGATESISMFRDRRADGFILIAPPTDSDIVDAIVDLGVPLVTVTAGVKPGVLDVDVDDIHGGRLAAAHLRKLGHRRIAHICGNTDLASTPTRRAGFEAEMLRLNLPVPGGYIQFATYDGDKVEQAVDALLMLQPMPTAIFTGNDKMAVVAIRVLQARGFRVPQDISVIGYDDAPLAVLTSPALTTIRQPLKQMGALAASLLLRIVNGETMEPKAHLLTPEIIVRGTTGPAKSQ